ncbi:hypothetical protein [Neobacillus cucumis]|uniref:hypothetical protein n=1 Tax=Neobacillus cucumis TaxID=1740721 RepID=UPI002E22204E|nr:hypothetical protein [Neobacillus cucumis]
MKKGLLAIVFPFILLLSGCFSDPVQDDLLNYVNKEMKQPGKLEAAAITAYESETGANYQDDQKLYDVLTKKVIPTYHEFIQELNSVKIETDELKEIHKIYVEGANIQYKAFVKIKQALEAQDPAMIQEANNMLADAKAHILEYKTKLNQLAREHKVKFN